MSKKDKDQNFADRTIDAAAIDTLYTDTIDIKQRYQQKSSYGATGATKSQDIITILGRADNSLANALKTVRKAYSTNAIFRRIIEYYATMFIPRYYATPRCQDEAARLSGEEWNTLYHSILDYVDGLALEVKVPDMLRRLWLEGAVYFTCFLDPEKQTINTLLLPNEYCQRIGESIYGTDVIQFDFNYFSSLGLTEKQLAETLAGFPPEFQADYIAYKQDATNCRYAVLDPRFSSCVLLNEKAIPTLLYAYGQVLNFDSYTTNELDKNTQALQTIVEHRMPTYQDKLLLTVAEINAYHKRLSPIVRNIPNARLVTTPGEINIHHLLDDNADVSDNTLENVYKSIYDAAGINNGIFYGDNQYSIAASQTVDRGYVWSYIEKIMNFYNLAINNLEIDLKGYQVSLTMIPISRDATAEDISSLRENAKVGVGVLRFIVASGVKQKDLDSYLDMEDNLRLVERLRPLRSSNTMSSDYNDEIADSTADSDSDAAADDGTTTEE